MEWIPTEERLPDPVPNKKGGDHSRDVLVVVDYANPENGSRPYISTGYLCNIPRHHENLLPIGDGSFDYDWVVWNWSYWCKPKVTHWMPMPDMPGRRRRPMKHEDCPTVTATVIDEDTIRYGGIAFKRERTCNPKWERDSQGYMTLICNVCNQPIDDDDYFCGECGARVERDAL